MGIIGEGSETIDFLEEGQVKPGTFDRLEAAEGLVVPCTVQSRTVLGKDEDDLLGGVVGSGDVLALNGVDQPFGKLRTGLGQWRSRKSKTAAASGV